MRDLAARVRGQITSDHCRSDLITGRTHWARAGYPFPEVNQPEQAEKPKTERVVVYSLWTGRLITGLRR